MSAFLAPIHTWLFNKIKLAQDLEKDIVNLHIDKFKESAIKIEKEANDIYGQYIEDKPLEDLIDIIRPIGTFQKKAANIKLIAERLLLESDGVVPNDRVFLESLNGVGRKTANVVLSNLYNENCIAVDTHVSRVSKRLGIAKENDDVLIIEKKLMKKFPKESLGRLHHQLVLFGRYYCKASKPECENCKLKCICKEMKKKVN